MDDLQRYLRSEGIQNFSAREVCPVGRKANGNGPALKLASEKLWKQIVPTLRVLEWVRGQVGKPVIVRSGYRDPAYNAAVGGEDASLHMAFNAIDFAVKGESPTELARILLKHPLAAKMGIGAYQTFTHVDTRGLIGRKSPARWGPVGVWWQP